MQRVQGVALKLIAEAGYAAVSIERIANVADVGVATIFRHFGTKDRIVLWDEADEDSAEALFGAISEIGVRSAVLMFAARLDDADPEFRERVRMRMALVERTPELAAQAAVNVRDLGGAIAEALARRRGAAQASLGECAAGHAVSAALSAAILEWTRLKGQTSMRTLTEEALSGLQMVAE